MTLQQQCWIYGSVCDGRVAEVKLAEMKLLGIQTTCSESRVSLLPWRLCSVCVRVSLSVLRECKNVELSFSDLTGRGDLLRGTRKGTAYLTPYRVTELSPPCCFCIVSRVCSPYPSCLSSSLRWCSFPTMPKTAWSLWCSPIIWWRVAASNSLSLVQTSSKAPFQLSLGVCFSACCLCWLPAFLKCIPCSADTVLH